MKKFISSIKVKICNFYSSLNPTKIEYAVAILIALLMLITYAYNDLKSLTIWSTNMLDVVYDLDIKNYFAYTALNIFHAPHTFVSGTIFNFIPWAIWNIPIWIFQRFFNTPILTSTFSLIWSKLFLVLCLILTLYFAHKIVMLLIGDKTKAKWVVFLCLTYFYTYVGVFYAGQTDIMICLLGTIAIYNLLKSNEKWFLIFASFAISIKYFFFFPYIALILLTEKNIFKIVKKLFIGVLPILLCHFICSGLPMYAESSLANPINYMLSLLVNPSLQIMNNNHISLFVLSLFVLYFISYITVPKSKEERNRYIIYMTVAPLVAIFMFTTFEFYRMILLMPFLLILLSIKSKFWRLNIILETLISLTSAFIMIGHNVGYFFSLENSMNDMIIPTIFNVEIPKGIYIEQITTIIPLYSILSSVCATVLIGCFVALLVINFPRFKDNWIDLKEQKLERYMVWLRMIIIVPFVLFTIIRVFI